MDLARVRELLRPEITELNRLPSRPPLVPYPDAATARRGGESPWQLSLDGDWRFRLVDSPEAAPRRWAHPEFGDSRWAEVAVPGCWTRQGFDDLPHYTNVVMPWPNDPPGFPERSPTGLYRRAFRLPAGWSRRRTVLRLGGFESVALVWCNGRFVGMGKDSRLASEFDLTASVVRGPNVLAVMVIRWSDATWIEDQDHWFHAGLHRSVDLCSTAEQYLADVAAETDYDPESGTGTLRLRAAIGGPDVPGRQVRIAIKARRGAKTLATRSAPVAAMGPRDGLDGLLDAHVHPGPYADFELDLPAALPWSAEAPNRYRLAVELLDPGGGPIEATALWVGFTRVEVRDRRLLVNGQPVMINGVNRHDHHEVTGKTLTMGDMRRDVRLMKAHNVNAVRTSHYPNDPAFLDLCDEYGLYVIDEANVECHARQRSLLQDPRWHHAVLERVQRMVLRDRNHPCVIGWSLGNESGAAACHDAAAAWARRVDPSRFVHYEGALGSWHPATPDPGSTNATPSPAERQITDIVCPMYAPIDQIVGWARWAESTRLDDRPLILCEYSHAMGNSNGSLSEYWDAFWNEPGLQGGFVWDWIDQGLAETDRRGHALWAYGGHFGDEPNDANFCINGLVGPDRRPHPALRELQWCARPVEVQPAEPSGRRVTVHNRRFFEDLSDLRLTWQLTVEGEVAARGELELPEVPPGTHRRARVVGLPRSVDGEALLLVQAALRRRTPWAPAGHVVAWDQFPVSLPTRAPARGPRGRAVRAESDVSVERHGDSFELRAPGSSIVGDEPTGAIRTIAVDGSEVVVGDVLPTLWRAPTDNDGVSQGWMSELAGVRRQWLAWGLHELEWIVDDATLRRRPSGWALSRRGRLVGPDAAAGVSMRIEALAIGGVSVHAHFDIPAAWHDLPRVGLTFPVAERFDRLGWHGPGPDETYPDRTSAATVGVWRSSVVDQYHPYVVPQEHGCHVDARWFELTDRRARGLRVTAEPRMLFSARRHSDAALTEASTVAELVAAGTIEVHVDAAMRGLGTGACGPDTLPSYLVGPGRHRLSWQISAPRHERTVSGPARRA